MVMAIRNSFSILLVLIGFLLLGAIFFAAALFFLEQLSCPDRLVDLQTEEENREYIEECTQRRLYAWSSDNNIVPFAQPKGFVGHGSKMHLCCDRYNIEKRKEFSKILYYNYIKKDII